MTVGLMGLALDFPQLMSVYWNTEPRWRSFSVPHDLCPMT